MKFIRFSFAVWQCKIIY